MKQLISSLVGLIVVAGLVGCGEANRVSFRGKPDPSAVVARSGLDIPEAGIGLVQPQSAGEINKDDGTSINLARQALGIPVQPATVAVIDNQFGEYANSRVGAEINARADLIEEQEKSGNFIQRQFRNLRFREQSELEGEPLDLEFEERTLASKGLGARPKTYVAHGHQLEVLQIGEEKFFSPLELLDQF